MAVAVISMQFDVVKEAAAPRAGVASEAGELLLHQCGGVWSFLLRVSMGAHEVGRDIVELRRDRSAPPAADGIDERALKGSDCLGRGKGR